MERAEGLGAVFRCQYQVEGFFVTYDWAINNTIVSTNTETVRARRPSSPGGPATLTILATPQHNNSVVLCRATISNGIAFVRSELSITATLTVHGELVTISGEYKVIAFDLENTKLPIMPRIFFVGTSPPPSSEVVSATKWC